MLPTTNGLRQLGEMIKTYREREGLSLRELEKKCNISKSTLSLLENGHGTGRKGSNYVRGWLLYSLADCLGISTEELIAIIEGGVEVQFNSIAEVIADFLRRSGMSYQQLARASGVPPAQLRAIGEGSRLPAETELFNLAECEKFTKPNGQAWTTHELRAIAGIVAAPNQENTPHENTHQGDCPNLNGSANGTCKH